MIQSQNDNILLIFVLKINQLTVLLAIFTSTLLCLWIPFWSVQSKISDEKKKQLFSLPPYLIWAQYFNVSLVISIVEIVVVISDLNFVSLAKDLVNVDVEAGVLAIITVFMFDLIKVVAGVLYLAVEKRFQPAGGLRCVGLGISVKDGAGSPVSEGEEKVYILAGAHQPGPRVVRVQHDEVGGADDVLK